MTNFEQWVDEIEALLPDDLSEINFASVHFLPSPWARRLRALSAATRSHYQAFSPVAADVLYAAMEKKRVIRCCRACLPDRERL